MQIINLQSKRSSWRVERRRAVGASAAIQIRSHFCIATKKRYTQRRSTRTFGLQIYAARRCKLENCVAIEWEGVAGLIPVKFFVESYSNIKIIIFRITTLNEFGFAVLEINPVTVFDDGEYTIVAINPLGEARQSAVVQVVGKL